MKALYLVISVFLDNKVWSLRMRSILLFKLANTLFRWSWKVNMKSKMTPKYFWEKFLETLLLFEIKGGWINFFDLRLIITSWACLLGIFHGKAQSLSFSSHHLNLLKKKRNENKDVSSAKNFVLEVKLSDKLYIS